MPDMCPRTTQRRKLAQRHEEVLGVFLHRFEFGVNVEFGNINDIGTPL